MDTISVRELIEKILNEREKLHEFRYVSQEKSLTLAREALEKRLESMNEFRDQLKDQAGTFISRNEYASFVDRIGDDIKKLNSAKDVLEGKASATSVYVSWFLASLALFISILGMIL